MVKKPIKVNFSAHLRRFIELPDSCEVSGETVRDLIEELEMAYPGVSDYVLHENGKLRQHVNLFLDREMISDRENLSDPVSESTELFIMQALSGG